MSIKKLTCFILLCLSVPATAGIRVLTTTTDLKSIVEEVGGPYLEVSSISHGTQDPHYVEAKPSFMVKTNRADLVVSIGLGLESSWLPTILRGSRNPKVLPGSPGYLEIGPLISRLEIPTGKLSRADGDVHPEGNPHITLDPVRCTQISKLIAKRLGELDPKNRDHFKAREKKFNKAMLKKIKIWTEKIHRSGIKSVITYHKTLTYFLDRFKIKNPAVLEPKPGIPPSVGHIVSLIDRVKKDSIRLILIENYFDPSVSKRIQQDVPSLRIETVPVAVEGAPNIKTIFDLFDQIVQIIARKK